MGDNMGEAGMEGNAAKGDASREGYRALLRVTGLLDRVMQPYFNRFGISRSQWGCLRVLFRAEQEGVPGLRPVELGRRLLVRPPSITGLIDRLRGLGYVTSSSSVTDARGKEVHLTANGRGLVERILKGHAAQIACVMGGLDAQGLLQLNLLLRQLAVHLESIAEGDNPRENTRPIRRPSAEEHRLRSRSGSVSG